MNASSFTRILVYFFKVNYETNDEVTKLATGADGKGIIIKAVLSSKQKRANY